MAINRLFMRILLAFGGGGGKQGISMELNLHPIATQCFVSGRAFDAGDRVASFLVRELSGEVARRDVLESAIPPAAGADAGTASTGVVWPPPFIYCRWVTGFKPRAVEENSDRALKLTAENLFLTLADPAAEPNSANTPLLQFLALMLERKKLLKPRGFSADGSRQIFEHMPSHQNYEVPVGTLDDAFFLKIQEHLDVLVGAPKPKTAVPVPVISPSA